MGNGRGAARCGRRSRVRPADQEEQSLFSSYVKYKPLKNNTACGTDPSQLRGSWRFPEEHERGAGTGAGI